MIFILADVKRYLNVVLICISLMINNVAHLSMRLLATGMSSLEKCLCRSSVHFSVGLFAFWMLHELFINFGCSIKVFSFLASSGDCQLLVFLAFIDVSFESLPSSSHDIYICVFVFT